MNAFDFWVVAFDWRAVFGSGEMNDLKRGPRDSEARGWRLLVSVSHLIFEGGEKLTIVANILSNSGHRM